MECGVCFRLSVEEHALDWFVDSPRFTCAIGASVFFGSCSSRSIPLLWVVWLLGGPLLGLALWLPLCFPRERFHFCSMLYVGQRLCRPFCCHHPCQCNCHSYHRYRRCWCSVPSSGFYVMREPQCKGLVIPVISGVKQRHNWMTRHWK